MSYALGLTMNIEDNFDFHLARLLILLREISGAEKKRISGITKVVKLDFLLRYPTVLEVALNEVHASIETLDIKEHERKSVEAKMVRFKYGPWDNRYRLFLSILWAKGLILVERQGKTLQFQISDKGLEVSEQLVGRKEFRDYVTRSQAIKKHFADYQGTTLASKIYGWLPFLSEMKFGDEILP